MRVLIVDDEPLARRGVRVCLAAAQDVEIVGECASGSEALRYITELRPDLVFLDVQMPGMKGFDVVARIGPEVNPLIIFLTAYDEFALQAFSVHALDYVLKPIHDARFAEALQLARQRLADRQAGTLLKDIQHLLNAPGQLTNPASYLAKIAVKTGRRTVFVSTDTIEWIEASGDYVTLHVGKQIYLMRETLEGLEQSLNPADFVRIHRSTIISRRQPAMTKRGEPLPINQAMNRPRAKLGLDLSAWMAIVFVTVTVFLLGFRMLAIISFPMSMVHCP
jgi:two-component system, LytTR family, response regulator